MNTFKSNTAKAVVGLVTGLFVFLGASVASAYDFSTSPNLKVGVTNAAVKELQMFLNSHGFAVSTSGVGSAGMESMYFGAKTKAAVMAFQTAKSISPVSGLVGPLTKAALNVAQGNNDNNNNNNNNNNNTSTGPLSVMLSQDNPAVGTILSGQALADLAHFTFSGNGTLTQVTLQRTGLSTSSDISNVYLFDGNMRVTEGASVNTSGAVVFSGLNIAVNGSKNLSVRADMSSPTTSVSLGVTLTGYKVSGSTTANTANVTGNLMFVSTAPNGTATATITTAASTGAPTASINAGSMGYTVWSAPIQVSGRSAWLRGANFRVIGSAPTDAVQNIKFYVDGTQAGSATSVNANGYAFFDFGTSPVNLTTGSHTIDVRGDIQKGSNRTFQFSIQNGADIMLVDSQIGINIALGSAVANGAAGTITINPGSVTTTIDPSFQMMTNVTGGATNAVIGRFKMHAYGEDVKVNTLSITPNVGSGVAAGSSDLNSLNNVTLFFNGSQVGSSFNWTAGATSVSLGSSLVVPAGVDSTLEVRADIQSSDNYNFTSGTTTVALNVGSNNGQGMNSLTTSIAVPSATITTSGLSIATGSLSVAKNTALANQSVSPNTANATIGSFVLQNQSSSESVRVSNLAIGLGLNNAGSTNYSNLKTDETSGSGAIPINPATCTVTSTCMDNSGTPDGTSSNNFSVSFTLAPGATKVINVITDISSATGSLAVTLVPTAIGVSSNVNVTPSSVTGQTITVQTATFGTPTLLTSSTTARFVASAANPTTGAGAVDGSQASFNLSSSNGAATVTEAKFVVRGSTTVSGLGTVASVRLGSMTAPIVLATTNSTTLSATASSGSTVATVASGTGIAVGSVLLVDSEQMLVTASVADITHWTVTRAYNGTTAAAHDSGATVYVKNGTAYFTGLSIAVPNSTAGITVDTFPTYSAVGTNGTTSGSVATLSLSYLKYTLGNSTQTSCVTSLSCNTNMAEVSANTMTLVGSKPIVASAKPTGVTLSAASTPAIDVTVSADSKGDITLVSFPITVGLTGASVSTSSTSNVAVYVGSDTSVNYASSSTAFSAVTGGSSVITITNSGYRIPAGESRVFHVYVTPVGIATANPGNDQMTTSLGASSSFTWTDTAGGGSATTGASGSTTLISGYPSSFTSIITN